MTIASMRNGFLDGSRNTDVCIIGGGIAGLLAARKLSQSGLGVIVLESGSYDAEDTFMSSLNETISEIDTFTSATYGRFRGLGGSSARWGGRFLPLTYDEVGDRPYVDLPGWTRPPQDFEQHRDELEDYFGLPAGTYEAEAVGNLTKLVAELKTDPEFRIRWPKWAPYDRVNVGSTLRKFFDEDRNVEIILDSTVTSLNVNAVGYLETVTAKSPTGQQLRVRAREYVLSAGCIENTRLMLVCDRANNGRIFGADHSLGSYLQDHLGARVAELRPRPGGAANELFGYRFQSGARRSLHLDLRSVSQEVDRVGAAFAHVTMIPGPKSATESLKRIVRSQQTGDRPRRSDVLAVARSPVQLASGAWWRIAKKQHYWPPDLRHQMNIWFEQLPDLNNKLTLAGDLDPFQVPKAKFTWAIRESDYATLSSAHARLRAFWRRRDLDRVADLDWDADCESPEQVATRLNVVQLNHPSGTTRMGPTANSSVVSADLRCHSLPNLSIVGSSVFPTSGATGPTYTIGLMALEVAHRLTETMRAVPDTGNSLRTR